ncbi:glutamate--cysteine ligase EgtA [Mycolicibacterium chitae]|uniref:Glutamate--cysteine ligase EgtA n=1 Tax=Mycolicibacterium chitae TaxID=1792 RepID=A0A3S4RIF5_MYCCI|nr:ergothioneine biosynthesis glutamate--cysteine ligase EgtA [Mycolicibacterium chitae]MCV7104270.1 ergothioneine biosynthesis glutamate--cysteine ligase EgtA [Mycolicibacterium chitae]BBZ02358.1 glutamate--cysteine ligase EgtA [Mycolicibacterium chitae]VEG44784.1 glutamate--cysteine ligase family protein [Mycolicibacterium chitae]
MTFVVAPPDGVRDQHDVCELAGSAEAAQYISAASLYDGQVGRVGLEIEAHCIDLADPCRRPTWSEIGAVIAGIGPLPGAGRITLEPGGAVELSGPPADGPLPAIRAMAADRAVLGAAFADAGLGLLLLGADPLRPLQRINPGPRYAAMERFFAASGTAEAGAAMMTATASVQLNLEAGPAAGWAERVRLAHALGPTMIAMAANSPLLGGRFTGWVSSRQQVWGRLDSARCGPVLGASGLDPATDWARYALKAPVMLVLPDAIAVEDWVPFADWAEGRVLLGGRRPTTADLDYHLTTLFPPVRPRGWLEIRYLDAVPDALWPAVVFTLTTLLDDPRAAAAAEAVAPVADAWDTAARLGLRDQRLHAAAVACVQTALELAPPDLAESMALLADAVDRGRCAADDFADAAVRKGVAPAAVALAQGDS